MAVHVPRATGAGAGGATALAQAAVQSKRGMSNTIQQQESQNAMARAQGEQAAQAQRIAQKQRVEQANILGRTFEFQAKEGRSIADISRQAGMVQQYGQQRAEALGGMGSNTSSFLGEALSDRRLKQDIEFFYVGGTRKNVGGVSKIVSCASNQ